MHIAHLGATGFVGMATLPDLLAQLPRSRLDGTPAKLATREGLTAVAADANDAAQVATASRLHGTEGSLNKPPHAVLGLA